MDIDSFTAVTRTAITEGDMIDRCTVSIRSTDKSFANISTLRATGVLNTFGAGWTIGIRLAFECEATAFVVWIADVSVAAGAMECAFVICTKSAWAAWCIATEIDGRTLCIRIAAKARLTIADWTMVFGRAQCLLAACFSHLTRQFA